MYNIWTLMYSNWKSNKKKSLQEKKWLDFSILPILAEKSFNNLKTNTNILDIIEYKYIGYYRNILIKYYLRYFLYIFLYIFNSDN